MIARLCLVAQCVMLLHVLLVPHTRCAAHGETVHARRSASHDVTTAFSEELPGWFALGLDADHGDDHCQACMDRRGDVAVVVPASAPITCVRVISDSSPSRSVDRPEALYRLAPKAGPPRLA
jgi:hypothetical protein